MNRRNKITNAPVSSLKFNQRREDEEETADYDNTVTTQDSMAGPLIIKRRFWEQKSIIGKQHKIGFFSIVALVCVLVIMVLWYLGIIPGIGDGWYRYGGALFYISLIVYIIGAGVIFGERIEFYVITTVLHVTALIINSFIIAGLIYSYITCIDGTNPSPNCVYPYIIDAVFLAIVSVLVITGAITAGCLLSMIWRYRRVTSYKRKRK